MPWSKKSVISCGVLFRKLLPGIHQPENLKLMSILKFMHVDNCASRMYKRYKYRLAMSRTIRATDSLSLEAN